MSDLLNLLSARYGGHVPTALFELNPTLETLLNHKSVRQYLSKPLPENALELLISAAQSAASSSNLQLWSVIAITDAEGKKRLSALANHQTHIEQAPLFLVWLADVTRLETLLKQENFDAQTLYQLDFFLIAVIDAALAAQNAVVAAEAQGWGTVYIGALRHNVYQVAEELKLPQGVFPVFGLCVGYEDPQQNIEIKPRLAQSAILHHETYQAQHPETEINQYDNIMQQFYQRQNMNVTGVWSAHCRERIQARKTQQHTLLHNDLAKLGFKF